MPVASVLRSVAGPEASAANARKRTNAAGDQPAGSADALDDRGVRGLDAVVLLADARQNEHVVVHGQPEQGREDQSAESRS